MSVSAIVKNGEVTNIGKTYEETKAEAKDNSSVDKEQFLQLLVAQMQYQDPLQPTDNTEYVSQLATFSELEQMQNMAKSTDMARAQSLVGQTVTVNSTNSVTGVTTEVTGKVESVISKSSGCYVYVEGTMYELDEVVQVLDSGYASAMDYADTWNTMYDNLPGLSGINAKNAESYKETVERLANAYDAMTTYQKSFISDDKVQGLKDYVERLTSFGVKFGEDSGSSSSGTATESASSEKTGEESSSETATESKTTEEAVEAITTDQTGDASETAETAAEAGAVPAETDTANGE